MNLIINAVKSSQTYIYILVINDIVHKFKETTITAQNILIYYNIINKHHDTNFEVTSYCSNDVLA